ncbi:MAG: hypothetical protein GC205_00215 [Bacteroidetes bacterium]|nr:hypothetical protein [Bacteroidota bacterium]
MIGTAQRMMGEKLPWAWQMVGLIAMLSFASCDGGKYDSSGAETKDDATIEEDTLAKTPLNRYDDAASGAADAQCTILRSLRLDGGKRRFYVLDICPDDVSANHQAINISPPGEPSVTTYFDTIRSFGTEAAARAYAEKNGIFDLYFEQES